MARSILAILALALPGILFAGEPQGIRGAFMDFVNDPFLHTETESVRYQPDGLLVVEDGKIKAFGAFAEVKAKYPGIPVTVFPAGQLITPGLIDSHVHYPQTRILGAFGNTLLEWLNVSVWPEEMKFRDKGYARTVAKLFIDDLLRHGTTSAQIFTTTYPDSVDAIFEEASSRNMRVIAGLTGIDRKGQAPPEFLDTAESFYQNSRKLIAKWHGQGRNLYAVTPRFAPGSTKEQLQRAGDLLREFPGVWLNTHLSENQNEVALAHELYPESTDYLNIYERFGLVGPRFTGGHGVWLSESEFARLSKAGAAIAFCPSSNLFLGSGLFKIAMAKEASRPVRVGLGTDMGGGNYLSLLQVLGDAYKVGMLQQGFKIGAFRGFFLATRGSAEALYLDDKLGTFDPGKEADFAVFDLRANPTMAARNDTSEIRTLDQLGFKAFGLITTGGDGREVVATYVAGKRLYARP